MKKYTVIMVVALLLGFLVGVYLYKINYKKNNNVHTLTIKKGATEEKHDAE